MVASEVARRIYATYEGGDLISVCAWCRRVEFDGEWALAPRAALGAIDAQYALSHSICPECAAVLDAKRLQAGAAGVNLALRPTAPRR